MARSHFCPNNPALKDTDDKWVEGVVAGCAHHGHKGERQRGYRMGKGDRRARDREAGVVGIDRGGYIHG